MSDTDTKTRPADYSSDGNYQRILVSHDGPVCTIEMNVPEKRNPLGFPMVGELSHAFKVAEADPDIRVIILGATGSTFSGGHDLSPQGLKEYVAECGTPEDLWSTEEKYFFHKQGLEIWNLDKPVIARVQGAAVLGGFVLANVCDLIVAADDAIFWTPAVRMYNFCAEVFMEPWVMGNRRAKEYLFTGDQMDAQEAYRVGMVNRVVPRAELEDATMKLAQHIGKNPALGLKMAKRAVNRTMDLQGLKNALEYNFLFHVFGHATTEFQEKLWKPLIEKVNDKGFVSYLKDRDAEFK